MIDVTKCIGCRQGIDVFMEKEGDYLHFDFFASPEESEIYMCGNSDVMGQHLVRNKNGLLTTSDDLKKFFEKQSYWWDEVLVLAHSVMVDDAEVEAFFMDDREGEPMINKSNEDIERALLSLAEDQGLKITREEYPDLLKWKVQDKHE